MIDDKDGSERSGAAVEPRPRATPEMKLKVARKIVAALVRRGELRASEVEEAAEDVAKQASVHCDGYALAKDLDRYCGWSCDLQMAEELDQFSGLLSDEVRAAEKEWCARNSIAPPFALGTRVVIPHGDKGTIDHVYEYGTAQFCVRIDGETRPNRHRIVNFEDARLEAPPRAAAPEEG